MSPVVTARRAPGSVRRASFSTNRSGRGRCSIVSHRHTTSKRRSPKSWSQQVAEDRVEPERLPSVAHAVLGDVDAGDARRSAPARGRGRNRRRSPPRAAAGGGRGRGSARARRGAGGSSSGGSRGPPRSRGTRRRRSSRGGRAAPSSSVAQLEVGADVAAARRSGRGRGRGVGVRPPQTTHAFIGGAGSAGAGAPKLTRSSTM